MHTLTIRGLEPDAVKALKQAAQAQKMSVNQFVVQTLKATLGLTQGEKCYHDLDEFFGVWDEAEFQQMQNSVREQRQIDPELWK